MSKYDLWWRFGNPSLSRAWWLPSDTFLATRFHTGHFVSSKWNVSKILQTYSTYLKHCEKIQVLRKSTRFWISYQCTVVELSTRTAFLNIDKSLQFRNFWSQSKAFFMIRCMLSDGSGFKTFGALKVTICVNFLEHSVHKMSNFLRISACQWTMPSGLFAKKSHTKIFCSC